MELTEQLLAKIAGWEAMKRGRAYVEAGHVMEASWEPPLLKGIVQEGTLSFRAGLKIRSERNVENLCRCRPSQERGVICGHSVAVGLAVLHPRPAAPSAPAPLSAAASTSSPTAGSVAPPAPVERAADGASLLVHVIFPPNLRDAAQRGKVMVVFEAETQGQRRPLAALPRQIGFALSDQDFALLQRLALWTGGPLPAMAMLDSHQLSELLETCVEHPRLTLGKRTPVQVTTEPWPLAARARLASDGAIRVELIDPLPPRIGGWVWSDNVFRPLGLPAPYLDALREGVTVSRAEVPRFLMQEWPRLTAGCVVDANFRLEDFEVESKAPRLQLRLSGGLARLRARLEARYGETTFPVDGKTPATTWLPDPDSMRRYWARDAAAERGAWAEMVRAGFTGPTADATMELAGENAVLNFFARFLPRWRRDWDVSMEERLENSTHRQLERIQPQFQVSSSGVQWFDLSVEYRVGGQTLASADVQRLLLSNQSYLRLSNGKMALFDSEAVEDFQEALRDCNPEQTGGRYRLNGAQAGFVAATVQKEHWSLNAPAAWMDQIKALNREQRPQCPPLGELEEVLRPYQKEGVAWLGFLRRNGFGGVLADEMGLGKTLQTLAHLRALAEARAERRPSLVVCPTSLVANWLAEAQRFVPSLRVLALSGPDRQERFNQIAESDLVVTSYALVRRDLEQYRPFEFDTVVLDEAQHIKNRQTQNAQAVKAIAAQHRLVLTGTPLENSVLDLWSIFDFLMPGYLGAAADFRERYEIPIARHQSAEVQQRLCRRVRPFILRRLKREVAPELPARLEQVSYCELNREQAALYRQLLESSRQEITQAVGAQGVARSRMIILSALLRLRQVCCDLRLLPLERAEPPQPSGKLALFEELLEEVLDGGHRVLVFSQFVRMLNLLRARLDEQAIPYCYLDGATVQRAEVVATFQNDPAIPVFLISLKAGGVGLNLTGADTVIHFDPWWNPAVEAQATDRAHRLGQAKVVTSYKLITRGTIEEKILQLQARKRGILEAALGDEEKLIGSLSVQEMMELLAEA